MTHPPGGPLAGAAREALRLVDAGVMLSEARDSVTSASLRRISAAQAQDDILDSVKTAIPAYLEGFECDASSDADERRLHQILVFATNMEQATSSIICRFAY